MVLRTVRRLGRRAHRPGGLFCAKQKGPEPRTGTPARLVMGTQAEVSPLSARAAAVSAAHGLDYFLAIMVEGAEEHLPLQAVEAVSCAPHYLLAPRRWGSIVRVALEFSRPQ